MPTDAFVILERLRCLRESDGTGHSEPYLWPVLLRIDDNTLNTEALVAATTLPTSRARLVIKNDMRAGETAPISPTVGALRSRFDDKLNIRQLVLVVALWEEDETPDKAVRAGHAAFNAALPLIVGESLLELQGASTDEETEVLIKAIKSRVRDRVKAAIKGGLSGWEKVRVAAGTLNLDDELGSAFRRIADPAPQRFTLAFSVGNSDAYLIDARLEMRPVPGFDRCQAQVNAVRETQSLVDSLEAEIRELQQQLRDASPAEKPFINSEVKRLRNEDLAQAVAALDQARRGLNSCRARPGLLTSAGELVDSSVG